MKFLLYAFCVSTLTQPASAHVINEYVHLPVPDTIYRMILCADVPDNNNPAKVYYKGEPGHVFIVLESIDSISAYRQSFVWGFYPKKPVSCILFRKTKSLLVNNSNREYDASVSRNLTKDQFTFIMLKAVELAKRKYDINKYNCYNYAIEVFNSLPGEMLPVSRIKFPFLLGRGGSPCGLYRDLREIKSGVSPLAACIKMEAGKAPLAGNYEAAVAAKVNH